MSTAHRSPAAILAQLRARAPLPDRVPDPVENVAHLVDAWITAGRDAATHRRAIQGDTDQVSESEHLADIDVRFRAEFESRAQAVLLRAATTASLPLFEELLEALQALTSRIRAVDDRWLTDPLDHAHPDRTRAKAFEPLRLRQDLKDELARLRRLAVILRCDAPDLPALGTVESSVWQALLGNAKNAKELAKELELGTPSSIRKTIARLRKKGRDVQEVKGRGYYRVDFPPADILPRTGGNR